MSDYPGGMTSKQFGECVTKYFDAMHGAVRSVDDMLCHPYDAIRFCTGVRAYHGRRWDEVRDHVILKALLRHRKAKSRKQ